MSAKKRSVRPKSAASGGNPGNTGANRARAGDGGAANGRTSRGGSAGGGSTGDKGAGSEGRSAGSADGRGAEKRGRAGATTKSSPARRPAAPPPGSALARPVTLGRVLTYLAALVLGGLVGLAGSLVQAAWSPGGLLLALAAVGGLCYGAGVATGGRAAGFTAGGGWFLAVIVISLNRPEGDFVFASGLGPQLFLFGGMLTAVICTTLPQLLAVAGPSSRLPE
ncbi:DUF6113 family protein [Streptomyces sp. NBC_01808]|uniref:DUF6113 family protein n=1 Tax=Streptomyces sp. NBC_01808 TaxID=2975947 RepID=UPI002DDA4E71|nr:DUF6113 family protein [Streptomyces sp. NBC_01808]WSA40415.1 DUF6113 family protein [Streptomyces sp. NBC_01808]